MPAAPECSFDLDHYSEIVSAAVRLGFQPRTCGAYVDDPSGERVLVLRHDVDWALEPAERMADAEASMGIRSTYFVRVRSRLYDPASPAGRAVLRRLSDSGFEIGLHYNYEPEIAQDKDRLEQVVGRPVLGVAQHMPRRRGRDFGTGGESPAPDGAQVPGLRYDAYDPVFLSNLRYVSDSNRRWRQDCPHLLLESEPRLYLLTHPLWWSPPSGVTVDQVVETLRRGD